MRYCCEYLFFLSVLLISPESMFACSDCSENVQYFFERGGNLLHNSILHLTFMLSQLMHRNLKFTHMKI